MIIGDLIEAKGEADDARPAVSYKDMQLSYRDLSVQSKKIAATLLDAGIEKGERVGIYLDKRIEKVVAIFGSFLTGTVMVPIRSLLLPKQVAYILNDCQARILITSAAQLSKLSGILSCLDSLEIVIVIDPYEGKVLDETKRLMTWDTVMKAPLRNISPPYIIPEDLAAILYTSGSTGFPKGVVLSHHNIVSGARKVGGYLNMSSRDKILSILTFGFDYGLNQLISSVLFRAELVLLNYLFPRDIIKAVEKYDITGLAAVPTVWLKLIESEWNAADMKGLRYITNSGGTLPVHAVKEIGKRLPQTDIYLMYGLTEAFRSTYLHPSLAQRFPSSIGKALPGEEIMVIDVDGRPVKKGEIGELVHRGSLVSKGYWGNPEKTKQRFRRNPLQSEKVFFDEFVVYSGDYVKEDKNGLLYFIGRKDEMIKCAGNRVSPNEVEEIIYTSRIVSAVIAFGVPDEILGHAIAIVIVAKDQDDHLQERLLKFCRQNMPQFMMPSYIFVREAITMNSNGKPDRPKIKEAVLSKLAKAD